MAFTFRIFRFEPGRDEESRFENFTLDISPEAYVIDALERIRNEAEPTLSYRSSCQHGVCGSCAMRINGVEMLSCKSKIRDVSTGGTTIVIEPLRNVPIVKDLVVDMKPFFEKLDSVRPVVIESDTKAGELIPQDPENLRSVGEFENCIECGACYSACPIVASDPLYIGPAALLAAYRSAIDARNVDRGKILALVDGDHGCWRCHGVFNCLDVCPNGLNPALAIAGLRRMVIAERAGKALSKVFRSKKD